MKKLLLVFTMLFASVSSIFAYQGTVNAYGGWDTTAIDVNSYITYISISASWDNISSYTSSGMVGAYDSGAGFSNEHYFNGPTNRTYNNTIYFDYYNPQYFGTIYLTMSAWDSTGQATLTAY